MIRMVIWRSYRNYIKGSPVVVLVSRYGSWLVSGAGVVPGICINENKPIFSPGGRIKHTAKTITTTIDKFSDLN